MCKEITSCGRRSCALAHDSIEGSANPVYFCGNTRSHFREAICTIQDNVRTFAGVAGWPWYRIFSLVRPLIPKVDDASLLFRLLSFFNVSLQERDKERIKELEELNAELREENEKLRHENMKLSAVCEVAATLPVGCV